MKEKYYMDVENTSEKISVDDFVKAKKALQEASPPHEPSTLRGRRNRKVDPYTKVMNSYTLDWNAYMQAAAIRGYASLKDFNLDEPIDLSTLYTLDHFEEVVISTKEEEEKEDTMYNAGSDATRIEYLDERLESVFHGKDYEMRKNFGLVDDDPPKTATELVDRIKAGKFTLRAGHDDCKAQWVSPHHFIQWRDPEVKEDHEGYNAAEKVMRKAYQDAQDIVRVSPVADGLKALKDFEAQTFH